MEFAASLRTGKYLFIEAPRKELYDQTADPKADHNLAAPPRPWRTHWRANSMPSASKTSTNKEAPKVSTDPGLQERLNALGYVATDSTFVGNARHKGHGCGPER